MLSLVRFASLALIASISYSAQARNIEALEVGKYVLQSGNKEICETFSLSKEDLSRKNLSLTREHTFKKETGSLRMKSDLDPKCVFTTQTQREDEGTSKTTLKHMRQEICSGKTVSKIQTTAIFSPGQIHLQHQPNNAQSYDCVWKKSSPSAR